MPDPVFGKEDRVDDPARVTLPPELVGKSPEEVASYFMRREAGLQSELAAARERGNSTPAVVSPAPTVAATEPTDADFWNKPVDTAKKLISSKVVSRDEFDAASVVVQRGMIQMAEFLAREKHPDWGRFKPMVDTIMNGPTVLPWQRADANMWETAYVYAKGMEADKMVAEAKATAGRAPTSEPVNPGPGAPLKEDVCTPTEHIVASSLGLSDKQYLEARQRMTKEEQEWPLTMSNAGR